MSSFDWDPETFSGDQFEANSHPSWFFSGGNPDSPPSSNVAAPEGAATGKKQGTAGGLLSPPLALLKELGAGTSPGANYCPNNSPERSSGWDYIGG